MDPKEYANMQACSTKIMRRDRLHAVLQNVRKQGIFAQLTPLRIQDLA